MSIGINIRNRRKELGMTQEELADKMGYKSKSSINKIELGENDIPQSKIVKFAEVLRTTPGHLLGWDQEEINAVSQIQEDAAAYSDSEEESLKSLYEEIGEMDFTPEEVQIIKQFMHSLREKNFGAVIKRARKEKGLSVEQLAEKIGVTAEQIEEYEEIESYPIQIIEKLHEVLGITYFDLFNISSHHSKIFVDIWLLRLNDDELNELYDYAKYLISKRK